MNIISDAMRHVDMNWTKETLFLTTSVYGTVWGFVFMTAILMQAHILQTASLFFSFLFHIGFIPFLVGSTLPFVILYDRYARLLSKERAYYRLHEYMQRNPIPPPFDEDSEGIPNNPE